MTSLFDSSKWSTSPTAYWTIQYEYQRSGNDMQYRFYWKVWLGYSGSWYYNGLQLQLFINSNQVDVTVKGYNNTVKGWSYEGTTGWYTVSNKTSGTVPFCARLYDTNTKIVKATSSTYSLAVSPAPADIVSAPDFNDNSNPTIYYVNPAGTNVSSLQATISVDGLTPLINLRPLSPTGTTYPFTLSESERELLRNATNGKPSIPIYFAIVSVISGTTYTRAAQKTFSLQETDITRPSVQLTIEPDNSVIPSNVRSQFDGTYIQGVSKVKCSTEYEIKYGATVDTVVVTGGGVAYMAGSFTTDAITLKGTQDITAAVRDSRGFIGRDTEQINILAYDTPAIKACDGEASVVCKRWDSEEGTFSNSGESLKVKCKRFYSSLGGKNLCRIQWRRADEGTPIDNVEWITLLDEVADGDEIDKEIPNATFSVSDAYLVQLRAIDTIGKSHVLDFEIPTDLVPLHLGENGNCVGIGRYAVPPAEGEEGRFTIAEGWAIYHGDKKLNI